MTPCVQCDAESIVHAEWLAGGNPQEADLCAACMDEMWRIFGRTTLFALSEPD